MKRFIGTVGKCIFEKQSLPFTYFLAMSLALGWWSLPAHAGLPGHSGARGWGWRLIWPTVVWALQVQDYLREENICYTWKVLNKATFNSLQKPHIYDIQSKKGMYCDSEMKVGCFYFGQLFPDCLIFFLTCSLAGGSLCGSEVRALRSSEMPWRWVTSPNIEISSSWKNTWWRKQRQSELLLRGRMSLVKSVII